jgi:cellulose biosynthesis protein BcsQ
MARKKRKKDYSPQKKDASPFNPVVSSENKLKIDALRAEKHRGSICVVNYKGGVGKTTVSCLLGYYLAEKTQKKVLLFDIDPQCSLSLALGFDPEEVSKTELTIYNLVKPSKWAKIAKTNFDKYVTKVKDTVAPDNLFIVRGSFNVDELDMQIAQSLATGTKRHVDELFLYCKQLLNAYSEYDYVIVDCPPNKMFLTQAMLRACSYYLAVTIPDAISIYGMPRLLRWVKLVPPSDRPKLLGYVLNAINRTGGVGGGKVYSQQSAETRLKRNIQADLDKEEQRVLGSDPLIGVIPRLDVIARFLGEAGTKFSRYDFSKKTSGQPTVDECLSSLADVVLARIGGYRCA